MNSEVTYSLIAADVTVAMLVERTISKKSFGNLTYYYAKHEGHFSIVLAPTWPSYHVSAIKEFINSRNLFIFTSCLDLILSRHTPVLSL